MQMKVKKKIYIHTQNIVEWNKLLSIIKLGVLIEIQHYILVLCASLVLLATNNF